LKKAKKKPQKEQSKKASGLVKREILWRPDRLKYLLEKNENKECVFCAASRTGASFDSLVLWESEMCLIMMNKYPYNNGHLLIIPRRHLANLWDLNSEEFHELNAAVLKAINALRKASKKGPDGLNVGLNLGCAAGAGLPDHLHYHVVPRWVGDSNFFPIIGQTKVISETLEQTYRRLLPCF